MLQSTMHGFSRNLMPTISKDPNFGEPLSFLHSYILLGESPLQAELGILEPYLGFLLATYTFIDIDLAYSTNLFQETSQGVAGGTKGRVQPRGKRALATS